MADLENQAPATNGSNASADLNRTPLEIARDRIFNSVNAVDESKSVKPEDSEEEAIEENEDNDVDDESDAEEADDEEESTEEDEEESESESEEDGKDEDEGDEKDESEETGLSLEVDEDRGVLVITQDGESKEFTVEDIANQLKEIETLRDRDKRSKDMFAEAERRNGEAKKARRELEAAKKEITELRAEKRKSDMANLQPLPFPKAPPATMLEEDGPEKYNAAYAKYEQETERVYSENLDRADKLRQLMAESTPPVKSQPDDVDDTKTDDGPTEEVRRWHASHPDLSDEDRNDIANRAGTIWESGDYTDKAAVLQIAYERWQRDEDNKKAADDKKKKADSINQSIKRANNLKVKRSSENGSPKKSVSPGSTEKVRTKKVGANAPSLEARRKELQELIATGGDIKAYLGG